MTTPNRTYRVGDRLEFTGTVMTVVGTDGLLDVAFDGGARGWTEMTSAELDAARLLPRELAVGDEVTRVRGNAQHIYKILAIANGFAAMQLARDAGRAPSGEMYPFMTDELKALRLAEPSP